jgi:O-antigen ligase
VRPTRFFFLAAVFCATFEKIHWSIAGSVTLADVLAIVFICLFVIDEIRRRDRTVARTVAVAGVFFALFLVIYLAGYFNLESGQAVTQFWKGLIKFGIHFVFLLLAVAYLSQRSQRFYLRTLAWFTAGMVVNAVYGVVQLLTARSGVNLDNILLEPITGGASSINVYGIFEQSQEIFRPNALTGDPNHLGIMLVLPILILTPLYLALGRKHPLKVKLALVLAFLLLVEIATLSRSGLLGVALGALLLAIPYGRKLASRQVVIPVATVLGLLLILVLSRRAYFEKIISSRVETGGNSTSAHFSVYEFIPQIIHSHPTFGLGLNTFSVFYEQVTGLVNWGPHSFYVALLVETGLVGTVVFGSFLVYLFVRAAFARRIGEALEAASDPAAAWLTPLAWGMTAALAGTMLANVFYLTMSFYYFYVFVALLLALPVVYGRRLETASGREPARRPPPPEPVAAPAPAR